MRLVKYCLIVMILGALPRIAYFPIKAYWHHKKALCFVNEPRLAIPQLYKSVQYYPYSWETHFLLGYSFSKLKEFQNAKEEYLLCLKYNPSYAKAHYNLGNAYYHLGKYDKSIEHYVKCLKIDYSFQSAKKNLEIVYRRR